MILDILTAIRMIDTMEIVMEVVMVMKLMAIVLMAATRSDSLH